MKRSNLLGHPWRHHRVGAVALTACLAWMLSGWTTAEAKHRSDDEQVVRILNDTEPPGGREIWTLSEEWRVGGSDGDLLFGLISDIDVDEEGTIYVLDAQLCQVHLFSPRGDHLRTIFREGPGPGEVSSPRDLVVLDDGVGAAEEYPGKIVVVDRHGVPLSSLIPGGDVPGEVPRASLTSTDWGGGNLVVAGALLRSGTRPGISDRTYFLSSYDRQGNERARYCDWHAVYDYTDFVFSERRHLPTFWWAYTVAPDGRVYLVRSRDRYEVCVYDRGGHLERIIEQKAEPQVRTSSDKSRMNRLLEGAMAGLPFDCRIEVEDRHPVLAYFHRPLRLAPDGSLWVLPTRGILDQPEGVMWTYDVHDPGGRFLKRVSLACEEGDSYDDALFFVGEDRLVLLKGYADALAAQFGRGAVVAGEDDEPTVPELICYRATARR